MASFFFYSKDGDGNFLARRLVREGHRVKVFIEEKGSKDVGRGIVPLVANGTPSRGDIVVFDMVGNGKLADTMKRAGYAVIGASRFADMIELDRSFGAKLMQAQGIPIPETLVFTNIADAVARLEKMEDGEWFFKPHGNVGTAYTYGAKDKEDLRRFLDFVKGEVGRFELQRKVDGDEISFEGWFAKDHWVYPWNGTLEDKKFMAGNVGPNTGCMANVVWAYEDPQTMMAMKTLMRLTAVLTEVEYIGPLDLNMIIDAKGIPYGLEFSARFGYDASQALSMLVKGDLGAWLEELSRGDVDKMNVVDDEYALTMNVSVPPYPNWEHAKDSKGHPLDPKIMIDPLRIFPRDVMIARGGLPVLAGGDGCVMTIGETGKNLPMLRETLLKRIKGLRIPDSQYRIDPVERAESVFSHLETFGYETPKPHRGDMLPIRRPVPTSFDVEGGDGATTSGNNFSPGDDRPSRPEGTDKVHGDDTPPSF